MGQAWEGRRLFGYTIVAKSDVKKHWVAAVLAEAGLDVAKPARVGRCSRQRASGRGEERPRLEKDCRPWLPECCDFNQQSAFVIVVVL